MKYIAQLLAIVFLATAFASSAEAQILKRLKQKAQEALEDKAEQKIDEELQKAADRMVEDSWDAVFGDMAESGAGSNGSNMPFAFNSDVTTEESYDFNIVTTMEISTTDADGSSGETMYMDMYFKEGASYTGTKIRGGQMQQNRQDLFIIYDLSNQAMIMLMNSEDQKFSFAYDWKQAMEMQQNMDQPADEEVNWDETEQWQGYEKIGTKTIAGYSCDGYRQQSDQHTTEVWVTRENTFGMASLFKANSNAKQMRGIIPEQYPQGMLMEMTNTNHETGEKTSMKVTKIDENANVSYAMADYPKMSPSNMNK